MRRRFPAAHAIDAGLSAVLTNPSSRDSAVPLLYVGGDQDIFCGGKSALIVEAAISGFNNNCKWFVDGLREVMVGSINSQHELTMLDGEEHAVTQKEGIANDVVDAFIAKILVGAPPYPFAEI